MDPGRVTRLGERTKMSKREQSWGSYPTLVIADLARTRLVVGAVSAFMAPKAAVGPIYSHHRGRGEGRE
jgi:hypothetical protein